MDEHFYILIKSDALTTDPQGGLYELLPRHQSGLSRALRLPPACLPSPLPRSPSVWFPTRDELEGSRGQGFGAKVLPGFRASPFLRLTALASAGAAIMHWEPTAGQEGRGGEPSARCAAVRCGVLRGRSSLAATRQALRRVELHRLPPPHFAFLPVGVGFQALEHCQALLQALCRGEQQVVVEEGADDGAHQGSDPEDLNRREKALAPAHPAGSTSRTRCCPG